MIPREVALKKQRESQILFFYTPFCMERDLYLLYKAEKRTIVIHCMVDRIIAKKGAEC